MDSFDIRIVELIVALHIAFFRHKLYLRRPALKFRAIVHTEKPRYIIHTHVFQGTFHQHVSSEFTDRVKDKSASREFIRHNDNHVPDLLRSEVMEYSGSIKNSAAFSVNLIHPCKIIQITCNVFFSFPGWYKLSTGFDHFRKIKITDAAGAIICHSSGHIQSAAKVYHSSFWVIFKIICNFPDHVLLAHSTFQPAELIHCAVFLCFEY